MLSILRIKTSNFIDLFKDEIYIHLKLAVKQTVVEYVAKYQDDIEENSNPNGSNEDLIDKVRFLKFQEFLNLLTKVLSNVKTIMCRVEVFIKEIKSIK